MILPVIGNPISNQAFTAKKFRLPVGDVVYTVNGRILWSRKSYSVKEYSNPNAEQLYKGAQKTKNISDKARLFAQMGHYEIVNMSAKEKIKAFLRLPIF